MERAPEFDVGTNCVFTNRIIPGCMIGTIKSIHAQEDGRHVYICRNTLTGAEYNVFWRDIQAQSSLKVYSFLDFFVSFR